MFLVLTFQNLRHIIQKHTVLFLFIVVSQIICIVASFTVSGMVDAVTPQPTDERSEWEKSFQIDIADYTSADEDIFLTSLFDDKTGKCLYQGTNQQEAEQIRKGYSKPIYSISEQLPGNYQHLPRYQTISEKIQTLRTVSRDCLMYITVKGYTDDTFSTACNAFGGSREFMEKHFSTLAKGNRPISVSFTADLETPLNHQTGEKIKLNQTEYTVAEIKETDREEYNHAVQLNLRDMDGDFLVASVSVLVSDDATQEQMGRISDTIQSEFGGLTGKIQNPQPKPLLEKQFNAMVYGVSFLLMAVILLNVSRIYTYILNKRKHTLAVYALCGADKGKMGFICLAEMLILLGGSALVGTAVFQFVLLKPISALYPSFAEFFTPNVYFVILGAYLIMGLMIMGLTVIPIIKKTAYDLTRG